MIKILSTKSHWVSKPPSSPSAIDQCCLFKSQNTPKLQGLSPSDFPQKINLDQEGFRVGRTRNPPGSDSNPPGSGSSDVGPWPHFLRSTSGDRSLRDLPGRRSPFQLLSWDTLATEIYQLTQQGHRRAEKAWPRWGARWKEERKESYKKKKKKTDLLDPLFHHAIFKY